MLIGYLHIQTFLYFVYSFALLILLALFAITLDYGQHIVFVSNHIFLSVYLNLVHAVFFEKHGVTDLNRHWHALAPIVMLARADGEHGTHGGFFLLGCVWDNDAGLRYFLFDRRLKEDMIG